MGPYTVAEDAEEGTWYVENAAGDDAAGPFDTLDEAQVVCDDMNGDPLDE